MKPEEIDRKVEAIRSLMEHWGWPAFCEMVQYFQGVQLTKLLKKDFYNLDPIENDRQHRVVVSINAELGKLLELPKWLEKHNPSRWNEIQKYIIGEHNE